ncbi:hypothetical protein J2X07_002328 [Fictibacillus barbaricus]|uniref:Uncharacterized protein n=1 Tax=Fictibacillus barbaricus TaxID=182136 RepID=A0ABU1U1K7_9BACL|nr:hypothetical protein [Fictibacillus barbaricus]
MLDFLTYFDQLLFITILLSLFIGFYHKPSIIHYWKDNFLHSRKQLTDYNISSRLVIKLSRLVQESKKVIFTFQRMKVKYTLNKDLEDCCPLL